MKKAPNDTELLLHAPENEYHKGLPDLLVFKSCTAYLGNLKTMFMDKFRENKPREVFHMDHFEYNPQCNIEYENYLLQEA